MPSNPDRRVKLTVSTQTIYTDNVTVGYRLLITASDGNLMPNEIFLYQHIDPVQGYPDGKENFITVCNPTMLASIPVGTYDPTTVDKYYRTSTIDLTFQDPTTAEEAWLDIVEAVKTLKSSLDYSDGLTATTYWVGTTPPGG